MVLERLGDGTQANDNGDKRETAAFLTSALIRLAQLQQMIHPIISSKLLMHLRDPGALSWEREVRVLNLLHPLDPDAVVADVEVVQYVRGLVLPEDLVNVQQALEDAGLPWAEEHTSEMGKNGVISALCWD